MDYANIKINCIAGFFYRCNLLKKKIKAAFSASIYAKQREPAGGLVSLQRLDELFFPYGAQVHVLR